MSVKSLLIDGAHTLITCPVEGALSDAIDLMAVQHRDAIVITGADHELAGILTDHDIKKAVYAAKPHNYSISNELVRRWMTSKVVCCELDEKLSEALFLMGKHHIRHIVVTDKGKPVAILAIRDVLRQIHEDDQLEMNVLRDLAGAARASEVA